MLNMSLNKIFIGGISGMVMLIISILLSKFSEIIFPSLRIEYENTYLFRPWSDPLMSVYYLVPFLIGIILVWIWDSIHEIIEGSRIARGVRFGLGYWITTLPGMLMSYVSFPLSFIMVISWTITTLFQALAAGLLFTAFLKK